MPREVHASPSRDNAFAATASAALAAIDGTIGVDQIEAALADLLRPTYPAIVVHRQDIVARVFDLDVWYAYRDGAPFPIEG